ncbi:unnamed protein product [Vitrella brassicaformis CCMP3155]|uniref:Uncharacterized protein n=1 Tax=Vitrella brassicaformis (strain CCMP3155) TaxID=1169540 RepID=A0A0G4G7Z6_VITBC|nr:unnamed protein product [Vitrella brassicaformis CCMP3155]|eukprot:CEM24623.1 unnamed protein product [Vitrella brassicaformis CCMP3155]
MFVLDLCARHPSCPPRRSSSLFISHMCHPRHCALLYQMLRRRRWTIPRALSCPASLLSSDTQKSLHFG